MTRATPLGFGLRVGLFMAVALMSAQAWADDPPPADTLDEVAPCVGGQALRLERADARAWLDDVDRGKMHRAMLARYPMLGRFEPLHILLWRKSPNEWIYVSFNSAESSDSPASIPCFTATFIAEGFDITPALVRKYFVVRSV